MGIWWVCLVMRELMMMLGRIWERSLGGDGAVAQKLILWCGYAAVHAAPPSSVTGGILTYPEQKFNDKIKIWRVIGTGAMPAGRAGQAQPLKSGVRISVFKVRPIH